MSIEINWLVENKLIHAIASGDVSVEGLAYFSSTIVQYLDQSDAPLVHLIISEEQMESFPKSIKAVGEVAKFFRHEQLGWFIIYGNTERDRIAIFVASVVTGMAKIRHRRCETLEESLEFLTTVDTSLPSIEEILAN